MTHPTMQRIDVGDDQAVRPKRVSTGVPGLDEVLDGGLVPGCAYLVRGGPGTGKTMLGMHFLHDGAVRGERTLFITLEESQERIRERAQTVGLDLSDVVFLDLTPTSEFFTKVETYDIFTPAEVEREPTTQQIVHQIEQLQPQRVFLEALTQFRYLSPDAFQFHKQVISFLRFLMDKGATVLFTSEASPEAPDDDLQFVADGVINLQATPEARLLHVVKFRGSGFRQGRHPMRLDGQGMHVFPRLLPGEHGQPFVAEAISSGVVELDQMLTGGLERGTVTIITGPSGVGKTSLGLHFMKEAAARGERSVVYCFEEWTQTLIRRSEAIRIPVQRMMEGGTLSLVKVDPLRYAPDEFACLVREEVEQRHARIIMLDSVAGYRLCMQGEDLISHLHGLCAYLKNMGVTVLLINEVEVVTGDAFRATEVGISYMTDNIIFLRYLEMGGELHRAIGVLKKRVSGFEKSLREFEVSERGLVVGKPLVDLRGILSGMPAWTSRRPVRDNLHGRRTAPGGGEEPAQPRVDP